MRALGIINIVSFFLGAESKSREEPDTNLGLDLLQKEHLLRTRLLNRE